MAWSRQEFLNKVLDGYAENYDIERMDQSAQQDGQVQQDQPVMPVAKAALHVSESGFVLVRKAQMWSADSDEFVYFFSLPMLTEESAAQGIQAAYEDGMSKIDLTSKKNHMCTRITAIFICDQAEEAAVSRITRCRLYKNFQFGLKGWMEFHAVEVDLGKDSAVSNRYGRETADFMRNVLHPQPRKKGQKTLGIIKEMLK